MVRMKPLTVRCALKAAEKTLFRPIKPPYDLICKICTFLINPVKFGVFSFKNPTLDLIPSWQMDFSLWTYPNIWYIMSYII